MSGEPRPLLGTCLQKAGLTALAAVLAGSAGAFFLWGMDTVTRLRLAAPWLLWFLPVTGALVAWVYDRWGKTSEKGTRLLLEQIQEPTGAVPGRMAPLIVMGTLATHLCGGSAGREGTALQMGGSLAAAAGRRVGADRRLEPGLLRAGMAAGFGAVFGTPWAAAMFAVEVGGWRRRTEGPGVRLRELPWCLAAAFLADWICQAWGARHVHWGTVEGLSLTDIPLWGKVLAAAVCFGLAARGFVRVQKTLGSLLKRAVPRSFVRPLLGGLVVIGLVFLSGTRDYLGLGVIPEHPESVVISSLLAGENPGPLVWLWKAGFTLATVCSGFKGGEVTPLFFMGAALGGWLAAVLGVPGGLLAASGLVAVFGAAARTPVACFLMGMELFGPAAALPMAVACLVAWACGGPGLYAQAAVRPEPAADG